MPVEDTRNIEGGSWVRIISYDKDTWYYSCELPDWWVVDVDNDGNYFDDEWNPCKVDGWKTLVCEYDKDEYNKRILWALSDADSRKENTDPQEEITNPQEGNDDPNQDNLYEDEDVDYQYPWQKRNNR